jgi:hypothetical protein
MNRRTFLSNSILLSTGGLLKIGIPLFSKVSLLEDDPALKQVLFPLFRNPELKYHPFVRWWWNGNKVEAKELIRELRLLKEAGIGGVEINPVDFLSWSEGDDIGKPLPEWIREKRLCYERCIL